jgi:hypothetical protein
MNTSEFLDALRARPELPLAFSTDNGTVPAAYHLTEVKRVSHESVDCGSVAHNWTENQFELWAPRAAEADQPPMRAGKFLSIVEKVRRTLSLDESAEARVFGRVAGGADQLHAVTSVETGSKSIIVHLRPVSAQCKARDRNAGAQDETSTESCTMAADSKLGAMCGCALRDSARGDVETKVLPRAETTWFTPFESQGFRMMF